jgi:hypothetical protein
MARYSRISSSPSDRLAFGGAIFRLLHSLLFGVPFLLLARLPAIDPALLSASLNILMGRDGVVI